MIETRTITSQDNLLAYYDAKTILCICFSREHYNNSSNGIKCFL